MNDYKFIGDYKMIPTDRYYFIDQKYLYVVDAIVFHEDGPIGVNWMHFTELSYCEFNSFLLDDTFSCDDFDIIIYGIMEDIEKETTVKPDKRSREVAEKVIDLKRTLDTTKITITQDALKRFDEYKHILAIY